MSGRPPSGVLPLSLLLGAALWAVTDGAWSPLGSSPAAEPDLAIGGVSRAANTTANTSVDGSGKAACTIPDLDCRMYGAKEDVWLDGGPSVNGLGPDGQYFFAVLEPGGRQDPNDGGASNLSDDYDAYTNRTFTVTSGAVSAYAGDHESDSGGLGRRPKPNGRAPLIRLHPYADTGDPGGVYILATCSLRNGYPVEPRACAYSAFKVREGEMGYSSYLSGRVVRDVDFDDSVGPEPGLLFWTIVVTGIGPDGSAIHAELLSDEHGYWEWSAPVYTLTGNDPPQDVSLTVCEVLQPGWRQASPGGDGCHSLDFAPSGLDSFMDLDFANAVY